jgi:hypothetical protein
MSEPNPVAQAAPIEILAEWEGPAIPAPGVLFENAQAEHFSVEADAAALAEWIAVTAISGVVGNTVNEAIKRKVLGVLAAWRRRFGQQKIDEVKEQLFLQMQQCRNNRKITAEELQGRIESLFANI